MIDNGHFVSAPGCYDALSARLAEHHGFPAVYMTGLGVTASLLALPDLELLGMAEMTDHASRIASAVTVPIIADADTGYGDVSNVARTTGSYMRSGVAAIHLEDQASPKRCGHMKGVRLIEASAMTAKLKVALETRGDSGMLIIGRTDAFRTDGLDEAVRRANLYRETGVDVVFVDGVTEIDDFSRVRKSVDGPLMGSVVEIDAPSRTTARDLEDMGYSIAVFALSGILAAAGALERLMLDIKANRDTRRSFGSMMTYSELNTRLGIDRYNNLWNSAYSDGERRNTQS